MGAGEPPALAGVTGADASFAFLTGVDGVDAGFLCGGGVDDVAEMLGRTGGAGSGFECGLAAETLEGGGRSACCMVSDWGVLNGVGIAIG